MKQKLLLTLGLVVFAIVVFAARPAAQPTLRGPHSALPSWDQKLPASARFVILSDWGGAAVLDRETGLVWEKSPSVDERPWIIALEHCSTLTVGNRMGWRLPTVQELTSLIDPSVSVFPTLPSGHPFDHLQQTYWSANTHPDISTWARAVVFTGSNVLANGSKAGNGWAWCVRGGSSVDAQ